VISPQETEISQHKGVTLVNDGEGSSTLRVFSEEDCARKKKKRWDFSDICLKDIEYLVCVCQIIHQSEHCNRRALRPCQSLSKEGIITVATIQRGQFTHFGDYLKRKRQNKIREILRQANEVNNNGGDMQAVASEFVIQWPWRNKSKNQKDLREN
jgi:hypothetical protein